MLSVIMLSVIMLSVIMLSVIMLSVFMLSVFMLNVIMLSVFMLNVVVSFLGMSETHKSGEKGTPLCQVDNFIIFHYYKLLQCNTNNTLMIWCNKLTFWALANISA
jgi:hypothetical protein